MRIKIILTVLFVLAMTPSAFAQITNGSFEESIYTSTPGWYTINSNPTGITGWTLDSGSIDYIDQYWTASDGVWSIDLNGYSQGKISQTITTVPGLTYQVTFDMSGNPDGGPDLKEMSVSANGGSTQLYQYDTSVTNNSRQDMKWQSNSYYFVATGTSTVLSFANGIPGFGFFGPALDNVAIASLPPQNKEQCKNGGWMLFDTPRTFKNQGDCIQFVNTGK